LKKGENMKEKGRLKKGNRKGKRLKWMQKGGWRVIFDIVEEGNYIIF
jgi:hypothetical protein